MKKRLLGILLSFALMLTMMPVLGLSLTAYATSGTNYVLKFYLDSETNPKGSKTTTLPCTLTKDDWFRLAGLDPSSDLSNAQIAAGDYLSLDKGSGRLSINKPFEESKTISDVSHHYVIITCEAPKEPVPYIAADGSTQSCTDYTVVESSEASEGVPWGRDGQKTWYVVKDNVNISKGVKIRGDVNLILCDGKTLTVGTSFNGQPSGSIAIYAQSTGGSMGVLNLSSTSIHCKDVTINGGTINTYGIAGDNTVTINGGAVNSNGGDYGIYAENAVTINGGEVYTESEVYGIDGAVNGTVNINGGTVTAIGRDKAIKGTLHNAIAGTAWKDTEGKEGKTDIAVGDHTSDDIKDYKKVQFLTPEPTPTPTPTPAPASPLTVTTTAKPSAKSMTVKWTWNNVPGAKSYKVSYHKVGKTKWTTKTTKKTKYVIKGHKISGLYEYKVAAVTASGDVWSDVNCRYFKRVKATAKAGKTAGTVKASWKKDKGATGYKVLLATNKKMNNAQAVEVSADQKSYTFSGLKSGKKYYVKVRPLKNYNGVTYQGIYTKALRAKTK